MDNSIYVTLSRQLALMSDMDVTSNNVANMNTPGYSANRVMFSAYLTQDGARGKLAQPHDSAMYRDTTPGSTRETGNTLDLAIGGEGYFMVQTPLGRRYTRAGNFQIDANGTMVTQEGYAVLDITGQPIQFTDEDRQIVIGGAGNVNVDGKGRGQVAVVTFANQQDMQRLGEHLYTTAQSAQPVDNPKVVQGVLENSNVSPVSEMTHMINVTRDFGDTTKFIQIMYELQSKHISTWTQQGNG